MAINLDKLVYYKNHLILLRKLGIVNTDADYICPFCMRSFTLDDIEKLSDEHAPQHALGGKKTAITCANCNNGFGGNIDQDLITFVRIYEFNKKIPGSTVNYQIEKGLNGYLRYNEQRELLFKIEENWCDPKKLEAFIKENCAGKLLKGEVKFPKNYKAPSASAGLYKSAYIILFKYIGYNFLLQNHYQPLRDQIQNPSENFPRLYTSQAPQGVDDGVYICCEDDFKGFFIILTLKEIQSHRFTVLIPSPSYTFDQTVEFAKTIGPRKNIKCKLLPPDCIAKEEDVLKLHELLK